MLTSKLSSGKSASHSSVKTKLLFVAFLLGSLAIGYVVINIKTALFFLGITAVILMLVVLKWPETATMAVIFILYTNLAAVAKQYHGVPGLVAGSFTLLLFLPFANYILIKRKRVIVDYVLLLMILFLGALLLSSLFAKDTEIAFTWVIEYIIEGLLLYFLIINVVRNLKSLRQVVWTLLIAGSLMGSLTAYQELTHSYNNQFGGLAQRNTKAWEGDDGGSEQGGLIRTREKVGLANRAGGPIGGPNRYAQIMLVILPLGLFTFWQKNLNLKLKMLAGIAIVLIFSGFLLTYSRGGFVGFLIIVSFLTFLRYIKIRQVLGIGLLLLILIAMVSPGYFMRMESILGAQGLFSQAAENQPDAVTRGRLTEMLAALHVFLDYPIIGVGPDHYARFYSIEYMDDPDFALRQIDKSRSAHTLYSELAAETGLLGFCTFMAIAFVIFYRLWRERHRWKDTHPDLANLAAGFLLALIAYFATAIFLQLAYQRFYWIIIALAGATIQILNSQTPDNEDPGKERVAEEAEQSASVIT